MSDAAITFRDVTKTFGPDFRALDSVTLDVPEGSVYGVVGTSGAGKSTLIRMVNGLEKPTSGTVTVLGSEPARLSGGDLRAFRRTVSMVFQNYNLLESRTVSENVAMPLVLAGVKRSAISERVAATLEMVGLTERADHKPRQLSGGQRQRVGIARALVTEPRLLLCDEPTSALDPLTTSQILDLIARINNDLGVTVLIITHQMDVIARLADRVAVLDSGAVLENGTVADVFARPRTPLAARFVDTVIPNEVPQHVRDAATSYDQVWRLTHSHSAARAVVADLGQRFGVRADILHAVDAPLGGTVVGKLDLGVSGGSLREAQDYVNELEHVTVEVLP
ncbi:methionine ABC transporter ATP-binding protein [Corynebacterium timonense]|uniref:D-methionine transport system ATP-binding protein n=1 Tax=Corynebacterium timonense TaxID=441500 RepID=A0A1H1T2V7_9CORY|nr:methionine ABC transporter ATP-binding protein [Corynebacterium timonense]SDS54316.1 D-methionine transport system ATP-binding protein [Corynebacterium timonense]